MPARHTLFGIAGSTSLALEPYASTIRLSFGIVSLADTCVHDFNHPSMLAMDDGGVNP
jgi:hypothetical protein